MASPVDVSALMQWLSARLQVWLPTLADLGRWPFLARLWSFVVPGGYPAGDPPWEIEVDGEVEVLGDFQLNELKILVQPRTQPGSVRQSP